MTNKEKILTYLRYIAPNRVTNGELREQTGILPHQQVYMLTRELVRLGQVESEQIGGQWYFWATDPLAEETGPTFAGAETALDSDLMTPVAFERLAQRVMSEHYGVALSLGRVAGVPKQFDLVAADGQIVGDAKYYTLVRGSQLPPAKFATIAEYVWLLEKSGAAQQFLVFGNDVNVPRWWLRKYGRLVDRVVFYFLHDDGTLERLTR